MGRQIVPAGAPAEKHPQRGSVMVAALGRQVGAGIQVRVQMSFGEIGNCVSRKGSGECLQLPFGVLHINRTQRRALAGLGDGLGPPRLAELGDGLRQRLTLHDVHCVEITSHGIGDGAARWQELGSLQVTGDGLDGRHAAARLATEGIQDVADGEGIGGFFGRKGDQLASLGKFPDRGFGGLPGGSASGEGLHNALTGGAVGESVVGIRLRLAVDDGFLFPMFDPQRGLHLRPGTDRILCGICAGITETTVSISVFGARDRT